MADVELTSSLYQVVFFEDGRQELYFGDQEDPYNASCNVYFRPDRLGQQEKYIQIKLKGHPRLELDLTIKAKVCLLPKIEHLGMALASGKKHFSQMMKSQKPQAGCIQIDINANTTSTVTDFRIPFRCLAAQIPDDDSYDKGL